MFKKLFLLVLLILLPPNLIFSQIYQNWSARYNGGVYDAANALAVSSDHQVYVTGKSQISWDDCLTLKYDYCGNLVWQDRYNGVNNYYDYGLDIIINSTGNILVGGVTYFGGAPAEQYLTINYNPSGNRIWVYSDGPWGIDLVKKVRTFNNNIFIGGYSSVNNPSIADVSLIKLDENKNVIWTRYYGDSGDWEELIDMTIDINGNIYITAKDSQIGNYRWVTLKYDGNGNLLWTSIYNGNANGDDFPFALTVDNSSGSIYVTGDSQEYPIPPGDDAGSYAFTTVKYYSNGQQAWVKNYYGAGPDPIAIGKSIIVINDEPYVTGYATISYNDRNYITIKYNTYGVQQWVSQYGYTPSGQDYANKIAADNYGNIYVTGKSHSSAYAQKSYDYATIKYNPNGVQQWVMRYDGLANEIDEATDIKIDNEAVYVTGTSDRDPNYNYDDYDYVTVRYSLSWPVCSGEDDPGISLKNLTKINDSSAIAVGINGTIKYTTDKGLEWRQLQSGLTNRLNKISFNGTTGLITGINGTILFSSNNGNNWLNKSINTNKEIRSIQIVGSNSIYCAGMNGAVYKSTNSGNNWVNLSIDTSYSINSLYFINSSVGYLCGDNGIFLKTSNGGVSWQMNNLNINEKLNKILFINSQFGIIAGNSGTLFLTTNGGANWL